MNPRDGGSGNPADPPGETTFETGRLRPDPRLPAYLVAGFGALVAAIATGQAELAALGAPFVALLAVGLRNPPPSEVTGTVALEASRAIEGDEVAGEARLDWDGEAEVEVVLSGLRGVEPVEPEGCTGWALPRGRGPVVLPFRIRARSWGRHDSGSLWIRARRPGSMLVREWRVARTPSLRVLPTALRLSRLLNPADARTIAGMHVTRHRGQGSDFAELRPYRPGDRLRDISWGTSARLGEPWVRVNHPERTGTVLLLLDAVFTEEERSREGLARAARAAWTVASAHLRIQDRVGLLARGRTVAWLPPRGGRRARWMLLEELLRVGRAVENPSGGRRRRRRVVVPSDALVVGVTSLRSDTFVPQLLRYRRTGHATVALVVDTSDLLPESAGPADQAARGIWIAQRQAQERLLERGGVPTALVRGSGGVGPAILALRRRLSTLRRSVRPSLATGTGADEAAGASRIRRVSA